MADAEHVCVYCHSRFIENDGLDDIGCFVIPGYGAQGGKAEDIAQYLTKGNGGVVNSSRGILLAYKKQPGTAFDEAAYNECVNMKEAIAHACSLL